MTIREAIRTGESQLAAAGIDTARLDAELLLGHLLDLPHLELWLRQSEALTQAQAAKFERLLDRRAAREPLQYITGWTSFLRLDLHVSRDVLVPRPETEILAQLAIEHLKLRPAPLSALDWGTGSGCLALALARGVPTAEIVAIDASPDALRIARANATAHRLADHLHFLGGRGWEALRSATTPRPLPTRFDLIVSNPPYIPTAEIETLSPEVRDHEPRLALDGGPDGLDCFRELAATAAPWLKPEGRMLLEFGDGQAPALQVLFRENGWGIIAVEKDLSGRERILIVDPPRS